jgi:hypothetical protein
MGATVRRLATGSTRFGRSIGLLAILLLVGTLLYACSNQSGSSGPSHPAGQTGTADTATQIIVRVAIHRAVVDVGDRVGITVLVTNLNGRALEGRHVQLGISNNGPGRLDQVNGFTDPDGKFTTFLFCNAAGDVTEITAFVEGAFAIGTCQCGFPATDTGTGGTPTATGTP